MNLRKFFKCISLPLVVIILITSLNMGNTFFSTKVSNDTSITKSLKKDSNTNIKTKETKKIKETEVVDINTFDNLSEEVTDLYEDKNLDIENKYSTKTLVVFSDTKEFDYYNAIKVINYDNMYILNYETEELTKNAYEKLQKNSDINSVEIDSVIESQTTLKDVSVSENNIIKSSKSDLAVFLESKEKTNEVKVAILDTGIDTSNNIFNNRIIDLKANLSSSGISNNITDDNGHGTKMAEIIINNTPDLVKLMPIKIANSEGKSTILNAYLGIKLAIDNNADVINISMSTLSSENSVMLNNIIEEASNKGIIVVVAAGNDGLNVKNYSPANIEKAITVSAVDTNNAKTNFSNYGELVDYCSVGIEGTSVAAANVSAIVSLFKSIDLDYNTDSIKEKLNENTLDLGDKGFDIYYGNGLVSLVKNVSSIEEKKETFTNKILEIEDWKSLSDESFNEILFKTKPYIIGKFLSELDKNDFDIAVSKSEYLKNKTTRTDYDISGNILDTKTINCYEYCINEYNLYKKELLISGYGNPNGAGGNFAASTAYMFVNVTSTDNAFATFNLVGIQGLYGTPLSSYSMWLNGGNALTGISLYTTASKVSWAPNHGYDVNMRINSNVWSYGMYLDGPNADTYNSFQYIRQTGVIFNVAYSKPNGYTLNSVENSYPAATFAGLTPNGIGVAVGKTVQLWKYGSNTSYDWGTGTDTYNPLSAYNSSNPGIWVTGDLQEMITSTPSLYIKYSPIKYTVLCKDVIGSTSGTLLGSSTWSADYGTTATGATKGTVTTPSAYYNGYSYVSSTSAIVTTAGATVYRIFKVAPYPVVCKDVVGSTTGKVLGTSTWNADFGTTVTGATKGTLTASGAYYDGYFYTSSTTATVTTAGATVYRIFTSDSYPVTYIDAVDSTTGKVLGTSTGMVKFGATASGADKGSDSSDNAYYNGYYYSEATTAVVGASGTTVYRIFKLRTIDVNGSVNWNDKSNAYTSRPGEVTISLLRNGTVIDSVKQDTITDSKAFSFTNLQKYDSNGVDYVYTVTESEVISNNKDDKYTTTQEGYIITNTLANNAGFGISGSITWIDNSNKLGYRPNTVELILYRNDVQQSTITVAGTDGGYSFINLDKYDSDMNPYTYRVEEKFTATATQWDKATGKYYTIDVYTIAVESFNFTNTAADINTPPVKPVYENDLLFRTNVTTAVPVVLKQLEALYDNGEITYTNNYSGIYYNVNVLNGTKLNGVNSGKYEIEVSDAVYILNSITLSDNDGITLVQENSKYYLIIVERAAKNKATVNINLSKKAHVGYQSIETMCNYFKVKATKTVTTITNEINLMSASVSVPESEVYKITYANSITEDTTEYSLNSEAIVKNYVSSGNTFLGWTNIADSTKVEYVVGDKITMTNNITLYPVFK